MSPFDPQWWVQLQLEYGHLIRPLIVGTLVSIVCSVVGCFIVLRRMSFLADAIAHSMLAGVIGGYLVMKIVFGQEAHVIGMLTGAMLAGIVTVAVIGFVTRVSRIKEDTAIGIMYTGIFALGALAVSIKSIGGLVHIDITHFIIGNVLAVSNEELWLLAVVGSVVLCSVLLFFRQFQLTSFDPVMAASIGIPVMAFDYLLTACTSLVVVSGVRITGVILVVALIITPAATAYLLTDRLSRMIGLSIAIAVLGFWGGFGLTILLGASPGPTIVVTMTLAFLIALAFAPRYGMVADLVRRWNSVPQEIMEDVLGAILRAEAPSVPLSAIAGQLRSSKMRLRQAVRRLARQHLLETENGHVRLTEAGQREAQRLVRAHRLWETYLDKSGDPSIDIHAVAHQLEHISDPDTVSYLDDKLGHPVRAPHGSTIPQDPADLTGEFPASLLRERDRAEVVEIAPSIDGDNREIDLHRGDKIVMGRREHGEEQWHLTTTDGRVVSLDHEQADRVLVRLLSEKNR